MWNKIVKALKTKDIRSRIIFTAVLLVVFRLAANIPIPGLDAKAIQNLFENNQLFGLIDIFSGGGLAKLSLMMLGVGPYITASIIMQLLAYVVPSLERLQKEEGEEGQRKINQITRYLTVPLCVVQAYSLIVLLNRSLPAGQNIIVNFSLWNILTIILTATAGGMFLMWLGEMITERGVGNGISLIIMAGIVARIPQTLQQTFSVFDQSQINSLIIFAAVSLVVIAAVVFVTEGQRNIPVSYARRVRGQRLAGGSSSHLPLRVNQAGVIPIIFAISILMIPGIAANIFSKVGNATIANMAQAVNVFFQNKTYYASLYFLLVFAFTYFYTAVTFNPPQIAENIQKSGGFIPGIRPGEPTARYLKYVLNRITLAGGIFLGLVAILPIVVQGFTNIQTLTLGGTALLIVVSVALETVKQVDAQLIMRDYENL